MDQIISGHDEGVKRVRAKKAKPAAEPVPQPVAEPAPAEKAEPSAPPAAQPVALPAPAEKKTRKPSKWDQHLKEFRLAHPELKGAQVMAQAKLTYKKD